MSRKRCEALALSNIFVGWESSEETLQNFEMNFFLPPQIGTQMDFCWRRGYRKRWFCKRMFERIPEWLVTPPTNMAPFCWYPCVNYWLKFPNPALGLQFWAFDPISLKWSEVSTVILMVLPGWNSVLPCQPSTRIRDGSTLGIGEGTGVACWVGKSGVRISWDVPLPRNSGTWRFSSGSPSQKT